MSSYQTIFALSSGALPAAISVVRISGPSTKKALSMLVGKIPDPRNMFYSEIKFPKTKEIIDIALTVYFPSNESITGEDLAEFHIHGSLAVLDDLLLALSSINGVRAAEPGEFTRRALINGKMELTQVEALADLISAETKKQKDQAVKQIKGELSNRYNIWRQSLITMRARIEANLDFVDETDVQDHNESLDVSKEIKTLLNNINKDIDRGVYGERLRRGIKIALIGQPNVGKSSLINLLLKEDRAIVSPEEGTTRDVLEARLNLNNIPVTIYDTAGIRNTKSAVEAEGVKRAKKTAQEADIVMLLFDITKNNKELNGMDFIEDKEKIIKVYNKSDLFESVLPKNKENFIISCVRETGIEQLLERIGKRAEFLTGGKDILGPNRIRHISHLNETKQALEQALQEHTAKNYEITADFLRSASISLGRIVGIVDIEDVLDELFAGFCIGK